MRALEDGKEMGERMRLQADCQAQPDPPHIHPAFHKLPPSPLPLFPPDKRRVLKPPGPTCQLTKSPFPSPSAHSVFRHHHPPQKQRRHIHSIPESFLKHSPLQRPVTRGPRERRLQPTRCPMPLGEGAPSASPAC